MKKIIWSLKQLLPLKYATVYRKDDEPSWRFVTWRMWLGRSFKVQEDVLA